MYVYETWRDPDNDRSLTVVITNTWKHGAVQPGWVTTRVPTTFPRSQGSDLFFCALRGAPGPHVAPLGREYRLAV